MSLYISSFFVLFHNCSILNENGFFQKEISRNGKIISNMFSHQFTPFVKKTPIANLTVDVNYDLFWGEYEGERIDITEFINDSFFMDIFGNLVKTLTPEKALIQLVLHHYKEMNSLYHLATHNSINLIMFEEIYNLIINSAITPERVYCLSKKYNICRKIRYIVFSHCHPPYLRFFIWRLVLNLVCLDCNAKLNLRYIVATVVGNIADFFGHTDDKCNI